jgi:hypothetical protein
MCDGQFGSIESGSAMFGRERQSNGVLRSGEIGYGTSRFVLSVWAMLRSAVFW